MHVSQDSLAGPLQGLKVVELGQLIAGPFAAKTLADFGADIIKIEPPGSGAGGSMPAAPSAGAPMAADASGAAAASAAATAPPAAK